MSQRSTAPYEDQLSADGLQPDYEGHDVIRRYAEEPKKVDQPRFLPSGKPTQNGKFAHAVDAADPETPPLVRVYEKLKDGIWSDRGLFELTNYRLVFKPSEGRRVFKFQMTLSDRAEEAAIPGVPDEFRRVIPSWVKQEVFKRDNGRCVICQSADQLHFDHDLPFAKGGTGLTPANVRILCARHNLSKGARIE
jgi:hypothetical protein